MGLLDRFQPSDDKTMSFWEHLEELRWVLIKSCVVLAITTAVGLVFTDHAWEILKRPLSQVAGQVDLIFTAPLEPFLFKMKLGFLAGVVIAMPFLLYFIWSFVAPGLTRKERQAVYFGIGFGFIFFCLGVGFGYALLPFGIRFLASFAAPYVADGAKQMWRLPVYMDFCFRLLLGFGVIFQMPVILSILVRLELIRVQTLSKNRPYAIIAMFVVAAILTPPDPLTQIAMALPLMLLYEISILAGRWQEQRRHRTESADGDAGD